MQCTHSDLNLAVGPTAVAEHPRPDHFNSKPVHLLHQSPEELFTLMPQTAQARRDSKFLSHHMRTRLCTAGPSCRGAVKSPSTTPEDCTRSETVQYYAMLGSI